MTVMLAAALLAAAGLVIDGGYALADKRQAMDQAEQAARAGADALDPGSLRDGHTTVDPAAATAAAQSYLHGVGATGTVTVAAGGRVTVTVETSSQPRILDAFGVGPIPVRASATAVSIDQTTPSG